LHAAIDGDRRAGRRSRSRAREICHGVSDFVGVNKAAVGLARLKRRPFGNGVYRLGQK
jgi:hypothetical protein